MNFCSNCGHKIKFGDVPGDTHQRHFCDQCKTIHYQNPNMVVGCLACWENQILLCKRAIDPRKGLWTLPAGFLEMGEKIEEGAIRETREEANAEVEIGRLFAVYSVPYVSQIHCLFLATLINLDFHPGVESTDVKLFKPEEIPWDEIAFGSIKFTLRNFLAGDESNGSVFLGSQ